ncbi:LTA synthase family protein [Pseudobacteroides cellulosolvens]|uniref:Sulfatase n=2 Tax=Pseudobacteroides cellulosolvens TaxID=35825 RepID=A0A0L6JTT4_9FIRM|nr:LTA synthase family protein [Pseudobacteroides cellulosolvens]KNY29208.1 sulfatase [Pseudobacteroides cellulosolvens ATCC 35603 = DSM 2933]
MNSLIINKIKAALALFAKYWILLFYIITINYLELIFSLWTFRGLSPDFAFTVLFSLSAGTVLFILSSLFPTKPNKIIALILLTLLILVYSIQLIYYDVFKTPLSLFSLTGAGDVLQFNEIITTAISKNIIAIILLLIPMLVLFFTLRKASVARLKLSAFCFILLFLILSRVTSVICINLTKEDPFSQYTLYYDSYVPELSIKKLGLMTTMELDIKRLIPSFDNNEPKNVLEYSFIGKSVANAVYEIEATPAPSIEVKYTDITPTPEPHYEANILDIDFKSIISNEKNKTLLDMHKYFSSVVPTKKNEYTGIFKGYNLILITAEGFSPYAISPELTPTLYKMSTEGFVFNNFYNPIWKVSTSDGEFVACTGLIPKSGIWSFSRTGKNYMPFVMGNQFKNLGYTLKAYHNHSYKYYDRHISHPNMGYDYKGVGNGLNIKKTWPESDLEMIDVTAAEYIGDKPFHTYYMTVSGHLNYSFGGNYIARKNKSYVKDLPYSDTSKAYIACNLELEFAMKSLVKKLEAAGVADKTVIAISPDHYPYGLPKENIDELAGHKVEDNFELYKSTFILWKKGMDTVIIDKPCSSLDIMPTLSNLFGLDYDSRLLMGTDILSESDPLVIFSNRSWITDKARYNTASNSIEYTNGSKTDSNYIKEVNRIVSDKFKYSAKIIETDYYRKIIDSK